jgi:hypothetical protein
MDGRGDASVVWTANESGSLASPGSVPLKERMRPAGAAEWSLPVNIAQTPAPGQILLDGSGNATVFYDDGGFFPAVGYMRTAQRPWSETQWGSRVTLSPGPYEHFRFDGAVNSRGDAVVTWTAIPPLFSSSPNLLQVSVREAGSWTPPIQLPTEDPDFLYTATAIDRAGNAIVVWRDGVTVKASMRSDATGAWDPPTVLGSDPKYGGGDVQVGFDAAGNATAVWSSDSAFRPFGGGWQPAQTIEAPAANDTLLAVCGNGDAVVLLTDARFIAAVVRPAGKRTWTTVPIRTESVRYLWYDADVACDADGNAVAVWGEASDAIGVSIRPAGGTWEAPVTIATQNIDTVSVAMGSHGQALVVWGKQTYEPYSETVDLSELQPDGPILQQLATPKTTNAGRRTRFAVHAHPWGSPIRRVRWNFGDGTTANGEAVKHVYRHRGRYTVLVAATDAAGRAETASAIVTVSKRRR